MNEIFDLIKAAGKFDHTRGFRFISYAVRWIRQSILLMFSTTGSLIRKPSTVIQEATTLRSANNQFYQQHQRRATDQELADILDVSLYKITDIKAGDQLSVVSYDVPIGDDRDSDTMLDLLPSIPESSVEIDRNFLSSFLQHALNQLSDKEALVLRAKYGLNPENEIYTDAQIEDRFQISRARIPTYQKLALRKIRYYFIQNNVSEEIFQLFV